MGVQGLWQLLHPAGKPVSPSSLEGKVLAVDVSIWLHQTMKGMRDKDGNPLPNAHLQGLFSRVCKLLFYRIRPVFVFDGGVPALKKQTMAFRRERKENVEREKGRMTKKLVENLLQTHAVRGMTGERSDYQDQPSRRRGAEPDMFELPPMPDVDEGSTDAAETRSLWEPDVDLEDEHRETYQSFREDLQNLEDIDTDSPEFQSLPPEIRHEILSEMKEQRRENALARIAIMPEDSRDFSDYQLKKLIKQSRLSGQIESVRKEMNNKVSKDITYALGDNYYGEFVEANRVVSEDAAHYVLIKGLTRKQQVAEAERCRERRLSREERRLEQKPDKKDLTLDAETAKLTDKDDVSDQDEAEMEWDIRVRNRANRRILSDDEDDETSDESHRKRCRRERRGKSLVTRKGLRNVAKRGKGRSAAKRFSVLEKDEEGVLSDAALVEAVSTAEKVYREKLNLEKEDIAVKSEDLSGNTPPAPVNTSLLPADRSSVPSDVSPVPVKTSAITVNTHDTCANTGSVPGNKSSLPVKSLPVSQRTSLTTGATDTVKVEVVDDSDTEEPLKTSPDVCHTNEGGSQHSKGSDGRECVNGAREAADTGDALDNCLKEEQEEQDAQIISISPSPDEQSAEKGSKFAETQNRLLREEEHLNKAKEDKMAALLKSLEKRRHIVESAPTETPASGEDVSHQEQQELLLKQEEDLMKEKDIKMAALLQAVEKRSGLQTEAVPVSEGSDIPGDLPPSKARKRGKRKETKEVNSGFLEDVADLERKAVQRKMKSRLAKPTVLSTETSATSPSSPPRSEAVPQAVPALTVDYLEDMESMAESDKKRGEDMLSSTGNSDVHSSMEGSVEDLLPQDSSTLTSSLKCDELFQDGSIRSTEQKQAVDSNREHQNPASRQEGTKSTKSQRNERATEDLKVKGTDMSEVHKTEAPESTGGDGSEKDREEPPEHHPPLLEEQEDSEDEGFIEITFNPSSVPEDDLFPASIFATETPPGGTALANNAGDGHTTHNQLSTSCVDDDGVKETTESDVMQVEGDAHSDDMVEPKVVEEGDTHSDDMVEPKVVEEGDAHSDDMVEPKVVEEGDAHSDDMLEPKVIEEEDMHSDDMLEPKVVEEGDVNSSDQEKRERPRLPVSSLDKDKVGKRGEGRKLSLESVQEDKASNFSKGVGALPDLYNLQRELTREQKTLRLERGRQARLGKSVTEQINMEAQELLQLFGVPYVVGPMEAEAQCAHLELTGLTQGTITDDSDAWLFGASNVYKNFFNNAKYVEFYSADAVWNRFGLDRRKLINVALLCGSDYTPGIPGVGPVRAIEIMAEFPGEGLEGLRSFRNWWEDARAGVLPRSQGQIKNKLRSLDLHEGFPSRQVVDAYLRPEVDESEEAFTWGLPDVDLLQQYAKQKFGWNRQKVDDVLEPMMKELTKKVSQGRIHSYFQPENFIPAKPVKSKRLQMALDKFQEGENSESESSASESESESGSGSGSESESPPELTKRDKITVPKPKQNVSGSTTRGRGRGTSRGKRGGKSEAPTLPELGESIIEKANQILSGSSHRGRGMSRGKRGKKAGAPTKEVNSETGDVKSNAPGVDKAMRGRGRGRGGERGQGRQERGGKRTANPYVGKNENSNQRRQKVVLKEEVSLSESSSSSDDDESKPKKSKIESVKFAARVPPKQSVSVSKMQKSAAGKRRTNVPNVKQLKPASAKSTTVKRKLQDDSRAKALAHREDATAFKEAMGSDLDPSTMTLDDLGSDFSD